MKIQQYKTKSSNHRINATAFYHKDFQWKVILPTKVYNYLVDMVEKKPPFKTFKLALAMYYLSLIISIPARKKDKTYKWGYIPLNSRVLEKKYYKYNRYFDYFLDIEIIQKINYSTYTNASNGYRFNYSAIKTEGNECLDFSIFEISDEKLNEKILDENFSNDCPHLTKWLNKGLIIDFDNLIASMEDKFCYNKYDAVYSKPNPIIANVYNYWHCALMMKNQIFRATRDDNSDNRIHTNLTNLPKSFRPFLSYEGEMIASLDIKNSQPYFMVLLLERYYPEMPLWTIHDSICTTMRWFSTMQSVTKSLFSEYSADMNPKFESEDWITKDKSA